MKRSLCIPLGILLLLPIFASAQECHPTPITCKSGQTLYYQPSSNDCPGGSFVCVYAANSSPTAAPKPAPTPVTTPAKPKAVASTASASSQPRTLSFGARGNDVLALQQQLVSLGYLSADSPTGYFGALTRAAVRKFQSDRGIVSSGSETTTGYGAIGPRTRTVLASANTQPASSVPPVSAPSGPNSPLDSLLAQLKALQDRIAALSTQPKETLPVITTTEPLPLVGNTSCPFNGQTIAHGQSVLAYQSASVAYGATCASQQRVCTNGVLSGTYTNPGCVVGTAATCSWNNQSIANGQSVTAYQAATVSYGQTCQSQQRTCANGILTGTYQSSACTVQAVASCSFNSQSVAHGASVTAYQSASVTSGQQCASQQRTCQNGVLSGSYTNASCAVQKNVAVGAYFATWYVSHDNDYYVVNNNKNNPLSKKITPYENIKQGRTLWYQIDRDALNGGVSSCNVQGHSTDWCDLYPEIKDIVGFPIRSVVSNGQTVPLAINLEEMKFLWGDLSLSLGAAGFIPSVHNPNWQQVQDGVLTLKRYWATAPASDDYVHDFIKNPMTIFPEPADNSKLRYVNAEDPATVSLQKKLARDYGIDFFGLEWYWNYNSSSATKEILMKGDPIDIFFFKTPAVDNFTGALMWVVLNHDQIPGVVSNHPQDFTNETVDVMCERITPYVQNQQYTVINGRALFYVIGVPALFDDISRNKNTFISGFNRLRDCVRTKTGKDLGFVAAGFAVDQDGYIITNDMLSQAGFVNVVADGPGWTQAKNYDDYSSKLTSYWDTTKSKYSSLVVSPGLYEAGYPELIVEAGSAYYRQNNKLLSLDPLSSRVLMPNNDNLDGGTPEKFRNNMVRAYSRASSLATEVGKQVPVFLYAWNSNGEGTSFEPDKMFGCKYLDAIKSVVEGSGTRQLQSSCPSYILY